MLSADTVVTFLAASFLLCAAPGPDNLFVLTQSMLHGPLAGIAVTLGLCTGLLVHTAAVALGVATIIQASAVAFTTLKLIGAGYLLYLAWQAFRAKPTDLPASNGGATDMRQLYRRGIIMNVTNPKVSLFFLALLPQFADPARGSVTLQILPLGGLFLVATVIVFGGVALLAGDLGRRFLRSDGAQRALNRMAGVVFVCLALKLAMSQR